LLYCLLYKPSYEDSLIHIRDDNEGTVKDLLKKCRYGDNIDERIEMHIRINSIITIEKSRIIIIITIIIINARLYQ
jgi:hypothetical protein